MLIGTTFGVQLLAFGRRIFLYTAMSTKKLKELKNAFESIVQRGDDETFKVVTHKCKVTIMYSKNEARNNIVRETEGD